MFIDGRHLLVTKAPAGRHVYRIWVSHTQSPTRRHVTELDPLFFEKVLDFVRLFHFTIGLLQQTREERKVESVGVGSPNPLGELPSRLRLCIYRRITNTTHINVKRT